MQSKISFFNRTVFLKNITHFWLVWILYTVLLLCLFPIRILLNTGVHYSGLEAEEQAAVCRFGYIDSLFHEGGGVYLALISLAAGMVTAMCVFFYLYQSRSVQMFHALPMKRGELFWTNYLSGLFMLWIPLIIAFLTGLVICILRGITSLEFLFSWLVIMMGESLFFYSMTVFVGMFTGHILGMLVFTLILNVLFIGCRYLVTSLMGILGYGLSQSYANRQNSILSPVIFLGNKVGVDISRWDSYRMYGMHYVGVYGIVAVILALAAYLLYRFRRLESTGDVLCIRGIRPIFRWGMAACAAFLMAMLFGRLFGYTVGSPGGMFALVLITVILVGAVAFFGAEMLLKKRLAVFTKRKLMECGIFAACSAAFIVAIECNAFGLETRIPDIEDVAKADVRLYFEIEQEDTAGIEEIMEIHRQILADKKEYEQYQTGSMPDRELDTVEIDYQLKNGEVIVRTYQVPSSASYYANGESVVSRIYAMSVEPENYLKGNLCMNYDQARVVSGEMDFYDNDLNYNSRKFTEAQMQQIYSAYLRDIREGHIVINATGNADDQIYMNSIMLTLYCSDGIQLSRMDQIYMGEVQKEYFVSLVLNYKCVHTIEALSDMGVLDEEHQLLLRSEYWSRDEELYGEE